MKRTALSEGKRKRKKLLLLEDVVPLPVPTLAVKLDSSSGECGAATKSYKLFLLGMVKYALLYDDAGNGLADRYL